jgi:phosphoribosylglycinamide formyltransferase 1
MADFVVLASGAGTNFEAIARALQRSQHRLLALVTDNPTAHALVRAETLRVPSVVVNYQSGRRHAESRLARVLDSLNPDLVVLAGFMKVLPPHIVEQYPNRIVNVHPSLLPDYPGLQAIERSYADAAGKMGITIHIVDRGVDTGPVLARFVADRTGGATLEEMEDRIHELEHRHYPEIIEEQLSAIDRRKSARREAG